jgi:hypothetical protein
MPQAVLGAELHCRVGTARSANKCEAGVRSLMGFQGRPFGFIAYVQMPMQGKSERSSPAEVMLNLDPYAKAAAVC